MTPEEHKQKIEEIYNEAMGKITELDKERKQIINDYIKELENKKMEDIRTSVGLTQ